MKPTQVTEYHENHLHQSFKNKPISQLQLLSSQAAFTDPRQVHKRIDETEYFEHIPAPVPTTWEAVYEPSHPKADWSGLVSLQDATVRKQYRSHSAQQTSIVNENGGLVSKDERVDWARKRRDINNNDSNNNSIDISSSNSSQNTPRGIGANDRAWMMNPDHFNRLQKNENCITGGFMHDDASRWKTTYQSMAANEGTSRDQLIMTKRSLPKKILHDAVKTAALNKINNNRNNAYRPSTDSYYSSTTSIDDSDKYNDVNPLVGYRAPKEVNRSLLGNIADSIFIE